MYIEQGGDGPDLLVLLHGLGATAAVWSPLCEQAGERWRGRWLAMDLPGHGRSDQLDDYALGQCAASVARAIRPHVDPAGRVVVLGHSFGGVIALALATGWFGVTPHRVFGAGIKVAWTDEELGRMQALAAQPARYFPTQEEASQRYLKVSGLAGIAAADSPVAQRSVVQDPAGWRLAMDPRAFGVGKPPTAELMRLAVCPVHLGRAAGDGLVTMEQLRGIDPRAEDLGPHGHNVMVEAPVQVWRWIESHSS